MFNRVAPRYALCPLTTLETLWEKAGSAPQLVVGRAANHRNKASEFAIVSFAAGHTNG